jgi:hypothetical protein
MRMRTSKACYLLIDWSDIVGDKYRPFQTAKRSFGRSKLKPAPVAHRFAAKSLTFFSSL